jgi:ornithine cyclodeaminase/alanine dehydrogenase-like protein (mu-crystallin family)
MTGGRLLILSARDVHAVLSFAECADVMREALTARADGRAFAPMRTVLRPPAAAGLMALMPSYLTVPGPGGPGYGLKAICISPGNHALGKDSHQGGVLVSAAATGEPLAFVNASAVTEIRTAAVSALATQVLARAGADVLAIVGTGVMARAHALAIAAVRPLTQVRVAGREPARAGMFAGALRRSLPEVPVAGMDSVRAALDGADIVVTATSSPAPVLSRAWLNHGVHINAVGACLPTTREIDGATVASAAVFVDSHESAAAEAGDLLLALAEGSIGPDHVRAELGEVITGAAPGRLNDSEITLFESLGLGVEDLAAAAHAYRVAVETGTGTWVDF